MYQSGELKEKEIVSWVDEVCAVTLLTSYVAGVNKYQARFASGPINSGLRVL